MRSSQPSSLPPTNGSYSKRNSTGNAARKSSRSRKTRRRTILHEEYDEFSLKRMSVDDVDGMGAVPSSERREMRRPSMSDLNEGVELTSCSLKPPNHMTPTTSISSNSQSLHSSMKIIQRTAPVELWDDMKYPTYNEDSFEFKAINRISNYTYEEKPRYGYWHYTLDWIQELDSTTLRRGGSIVFVVTIVIVGAALIALAIPNNDAAQNSLATNSNSSAVSSYPMYIPIRSNSQGSSEKNLSPQQLLELAEQITMSCDVATITHEENRKICQSLCIDRMCCFEDDKYGCKTDEMCPIYMGCEVLFGSDDSATNQYSAAELLQMADEIIGYCGEYTIDPESADGRKCIDQCKGHMCCFREETLGNSCKEEERVWCEVYEGCETLVGVKGLEDISR